MGFKCFSFGLQAGGWQPSVYIYNELCNCHAAAGDPAGIWRCLEVYC